MVGKPLIDLFQLDSGDIPVVGRKEGILLRVVFEMVILLNYESL